MQVIFLIGLQASGKSSFYRSRFLDSHVLVSKDLWPNARNRDARQIREVEKALGEGRKVVVDNTNATVGDRAPVLALATRYGAEVVGYYFESRVEDCLKRNAVREGKNRVPDVALYSTIKRMERPRLEEGFASLHYVALRPEEGFRVSAWKDDEP